MFLLRRLLDQHHLERNKRLLPEYDPYNVERMIESSRFVSTDVRL
jgi:hypothetical protein